MDVPLDYLERIARKNDLQTLSKYLDFCSQNKLFCLKKHDKDGTPSLINSLLSTKEHAPEGLALLRSYVEQCPKDILSSHIISWINQAIKHLVHPENGTLSPVAFQVLGTLLDVSAEFPDARKSLATQTIHKIFDHFCREFKGTEEDLIIFKCLEKALQVYGKSCAYHKDTIARAIFKHLESEEECVYAAGRCYLLLSTCGGPGVDGENYVVVWRDQQKFILNSLHNQLDFLFDNITEVQDTYKRYKVGGSLPSVPRVVEDSLVKKKQRLAKQFQTLAEFLKIMLLGPFQWRREVLHESILALAWRALSVNSKTLSIGFMTSDATSLATVITTVNLASLEILSALIKSCGLLLAGHSTEIVRMLKQGLKWTVIENWPFGVTRPMSSLRSKLYKCLEDWLAVSRAASGIEEHLDDLIPIVLSDISHDPPTVSLRVPTGKGKKKFDVRKSVDIPLEYVLDPKMNAESCESALAFVSNLLNTSSSFLKTDHHRVLQEAVISRLVLLQSDKMPFPYKVEKCRLALYRVLLDFCHNSLTTPQPPINYAVFLFSQGIKDVSVEISRFCLFSLRSIEKILRPICPTLDFPSSDANEKLNISTSQDRSLALNSSEYHRIMKRKTELIIQMGEEEQEGGGSGKKSKQATSTPVSNSQRLVEFKTPSIYTPKPLQGLLNLSDFESGANFSTPGEQSSLMDTEDFQSSRISAVTVSSDEPTGNESPLPLSNGTHESEVNLTGKGDSENGESIQEDLDDLKNPSTSEKTVSMKGAEHSPVFAKKDSERSNESQTAMSETRDSDDEMLSSFVDEISES